jgi:cupin fold WbuC family metalloprotein
MLNFAEQNMTSEEVYHAAAKTVELSRADLNNLQNLAGATKRKRARFCAHSDSSEILQEMFIVHPLGAYVRPHKHIGKPESMLVIAGEVDYVLFTDDGEIESRLPMGTFESGKLFYNSIREPRYHSLIIKSEWLVFLEFTQGPFRREDTHFAPWSPEEKHADDAKQYIGNLMRRIK